MGPFETHDVIAELVARIEALEETVEELRYSGPTHGRVIDFDENYEDYMAEEWDSL